MAKNAIEAPKGDVRNSETSNAGLCGQGEELCVNYGPKARELCGFP